MIKKCSRCLEEKELEEFTKNKSCKLGYSNLCKDCFNKYNREKRRGNQEYLKKRRDDYNRRYKIVQEQKDIERKEKYPLRVRCQVLRAGMRDRARKKNVEFDKDFFTVKYLMNRLLENPLCECCKTELDIGFKQNKKFNDKSPSMDRVNPKMGYTRNNVAILCWRCNKHKQDASASELRMIADFMDCWGNEV